MRIDIESIARRRHTCLMVLRSVALVLSVGGTVAGGLSFHSRMGPYSGFDFLVLPVGVLLACFWVPAAALALGGRSLARWLVPVPSPAGECPQCGYSLKNLMAPICPECGLSLRDAAPPQK